MKSYFLVKSDVRHGEDFVALAIEAQAGVTICRDATLCVVTGVAAIDSFEQNLKELAGFGLYKRFTSVPPGYGGVVLQPAADVLAKKKPARPKKSGK